MCYTIEINLTREQLEKRFNANLNKDLPYRKQNRVSAFSLPECPVITASEPDAIKIMNWGLIPFWSRNEKFARDIRMKTFNAKAETLLEKPSFRHLVARNRCLVPVSGFYEWQHRETYKQPYFIELKHQQPFALAGLHDKWNNKETGKTEETFTIITTAANPLMEVIHNTKKRMPVILNKQDETTWVDEQISESELISLLKPFDDFQMTAEAIDPELFKRKQNSSDEPPLF